MASHEIQQFSYLKHKQFLEIDCYLFGVSRMYAIKYLLHFHPNEKSISHFECEMYCAVYVETTKCVWNQTRTKWSLILFPNLNNLFNEISIVVNNTKSIKGVRNDLLYKQCKQNVSRSHSESFCWKRICVCVSVCVCADGHSTGDKKGKHYHRSPEENFIVKVEQIVNHQTLT